MWRSGVSRGFGPCGFLISCEVRRQLDAHGGGGKQGKGWDGGYGLVPLSLPPRGRIHNHPPGHISLSPPLEVPVSNCSIIIHAHAGPHPLDRPIGTMR